MRTIVKTYPDYQGYETDRDIPDDILLGNFRATERILDNPAMFPRADMAKVERLNNDLYVECALRGIMI